MRSGEIVFMGVRLRRTAAVVYAVIVGTAFVLQALLPLGGASAFFPRAPRGLWLGLLGLGPALFSVRRLLGAPEETSKIIPAQRTSLLAFLALSAGSGVGFLLP